MDFKAVRSCTSADRRNASKCTSVRPSKESLSSQSKRWRLALLSLHSFNLISDKNFPYAARNILSGRGAKPVKVRPHSHSLESSDWSESESDDDEGYYKYFEGSFVDNLRILPNAA